MVYQGPERRKYPRFKCGFQVSYQKADASDTFDITQLKNLSLGGLLFTTSKPYGKGEVLALQIRLPDRSTPILSSARVVESREKIRNLIYDTRVSFLVIYDEDKQALSNFLDRSLQTAT